MISNSSIFSFLITFSSTCNILDIINATDIIQKIIVKEGQLDESEGTPMTYAYTKTFTVFPYMRYDIRIEVLLNDLGGPDEKVTDILINKKSIGGCNPNCGLMSESKCDYACTFYDCTPSLNSTIVSSSTGSMNIKLIYQGNSKDCDCDTMTWQCKKENIDPNLTPVVALARITLTPENKGKKAIHV